MDEPFGALDAINRMKMQEEIIRIWQEKRRTIVFVTHDARMAEFAHRVIHIRDGQIERDERRG